MFAALSISRSLKTRSISFHIFSNFLSRECLARGSSRAWFRARSGCGFLRFRRRVEHGIDAIGQAFHLPSGGSAPRAFPAFESAIDSFQHSIQRNTGFLPRFDDSPIERRDEKVRPALAPKMLLDFR